MLNWIQGAGVRRKETLLYAVVEEVLHSFGVVDAQIVHVNHRLTPNLLDHSTHEVGKVRRIVATIDDLVVDKSLLLTDRTNHGERLAPATWHLYGHVFAHPRL